MTHLGSQAPPQRSVLGGSYGNPKHSSSSIQLRRALALAAMTVVMPGSAQLVHGNRKVGVIAIRVWLGVIVLVATLAVLSLVSRSFVLGLLTNAFVLGVGRWVLVAGAVAWVALLVDAWRLGQPTRLTTGHRALATGFNGALALGTAGVMFFASHAVAVQNDFIGTVFTSGEVSGPHEGRYNLLLMGADSGQGRDGMRPDSLNVVSIDADTGKAVMIGLPRNLEDVRFPADSVMGREFPDGFDCDGCMLNGVYTWAENHSDLFDVDNPGVEATISAVEEISDLPINYYALVDMKGFSDMVDAVGGVTINVRERTAIGGIGSPISDWIEAGERKLSGREALWYARSRVKNDDWSRMGRQKCVMNAILQEVSPQSILLNMDKISESGKAMLETSIPRQDLNTFVDLALKTKSQPISTVSLVPPAIYTGNPDWDKVRSLIDEAIAKSEGSFEAPSIMASAQIPLARYHSGDSDPRQSNQTDDLASTC